MEIKIRNGRIWRNVLGEIVYSLFLSVKYVYSLSVGKGFRAIGKMGKQLMYKKHGVVKYLFLYSSSFFRQIPFAPNRKKWYRETDTDSDRQRV